MHTKRLILLLLLCVASLAAQQTPFTNSQTIKTSGESIRLPNSYGSMSAMFEEIISGSPATLSIIVRGCSQGGTCDVLDTNTDTATESQNRAPAVAKPYNYFTVTATWTGGTNVSVKINTTITVAHKSLPMDGQGDLLISSACPEGAPAGSICFAGALYQGGVEFSGGSGSGVPSTSATDGQFLTGFSGSAFTKAKADFNKLDNKPDMSTYVSTSTTVAGHALTSNVTVSKSDVGLGNVDNTADSAKPVSTAAQAAIDLKADANTLSAHVSGSSVHSSTSTPTADRIAMWDSAGKIALTGLPAAALKRPCEVTITGSGTSGALQDADDEAEKCSNEYGATLTIQSLKCRVNTGTTTTVMVAITGGTNVLSGNCTCGNATKATCSLNGTPTQAADASLDFSVVSAGTAGEVTFYVGRTL